MKTILFDIDGVLADFVEGFTKLAHEMLGTPIVRTVEQQTWDFNFTDGEKIWKRIAENHGFWVRLTPLVGPTVFKEINDLTLHHHVIFATNRFVGTPGPQYQTASWLQKCGVFRPNVVLSRNKGFIAQAVHPHFAIDDKIENVEELADEDFTSNTFLLDRPYNRDFDPIGVRRINSVSEFLREVDNG